MLSLSYTDKSGKDGAGAQVLRYAFSYGLAKSFRVSWSHSSIKYIDSNPLDPFVLPSDRRLFLRTLNNFIKPRESTKRKPVIHLTIMRVLTKKQLASLLRIMSVFRGRYPLLAISLYRPQSYLGYFPNAIQLFADEIQSQLETFSVHDNVIRIHAHIRGAVQNDRRTQPIFLLDTFRRLQSLLIEKKLSYIFTIFTDLPAESKYWIPDSSNEPGTLRHWEENGLINSDGFIELGFYDFEVEFSEILNLRIVRDSNAVEMWCEMSQSDIFIGCDSSISILAGYLNLKAIKIFPCSIEDILPSDWKFYSPFENIDDLCESTVTNIRKR